MKTQKNIEFIVGKPTVQLENCYNLIYENLPFNYAEIIHNTEYEHSMTT